MPRPTDPAERAHAHHPAWQQPASLFFADEDYRCCLDWLKEYAGKTACRIRAYDLMANHVHLLVSAQAGHGAAALTDPQDLADLAAYLEGLCIPLEHGQYDAQDAAKQVAHGRGLYDKECRVCHGHSGEGSRHKLYPVIAGQHNKYLLHQMTDFRDGKRRNANPEMVRIISKYNDDQLLAISAYQSSLVVPGKMCKAKAPARKP